MSAFVAALPLVGRVIERLFPDPGAQAEAKLKLFELQQSGELAALEAETRLAVGQLEVNKAEAQSASVFVAGWRPAVGWICAAGVAWNYVLHPLMIWFAFLSGVDVSAAPELDIGDLLVLLGGMLGMGAMRTREKLDGVAREKLAEGAAREHI